MKFKLEIASNEEAAKYKNAQVHYGLLESLDYLRKDPLATEERGRTTSYDHVHLSQLKETTGPSGRLVQWWGRASNGYHYPLGRVMKMVKDAD